MEKTKNPFEPIYREIQRDVEKYKQDVELSIRKPVRRNFYITNEDVPYVLEALKWYMNQLGYQMFEHDDDFPQKLIDEEEHRYMKIGAILDKMETYQIARLREKRQ